MSLLPTDLVDRAATLVAGIVVASLGAAAALWPTHVVHAAPEQISTGPAVRATASTWSPWELAGAGALPAPPFNSKFSRLNRVLARFRPHLRMKKA